MTDLTQRFISELIRAANEIEKLTPLERTRLFQRSATTLRDLRHEIGMSGMPANDGRNTDVAFRLSEYGRLSDTLTDEEVSRGLLEAVEVLKVCKVLLDEKEAVLRGE